MSRTYKERKKANKQYVLLADCEVLGVWGNLKKLCEDMKVKDGDFLSYSSLSKKKKHENPIIFKNDDGVTYKVYVEVVK